MPDETESFRRGMVAKINSDVKSDNELDERARLEEQYGKGKVWNTAEVQQEFEITGFAAPFCMCKRKSDGKTGTLAFQHNPRFYFDFREN